MLCNLENWLYPLRPNNQTLLNIEMIKVEQPKYKKQKISHDNDTYLWHLRLSHINLDRINRLVKDGPLRKLNVGTLPVYESCLKGKMIKRPFFKKRLVSQRTPRINTFRCLWTFECIRKRWLRILHHIYWWLF